MRKKWILAAAVLALVNPAFPVSAQSAAPLSVAASLHRAAAPEREGAPARPKNDLAGRYGFLLPAALVAAAIAAVVLLSVDSDPTSP